MTSRAGFRFLLYMRAIRLRFLILVPSVVILLAIPGFAQSTISSAPHWNKAGFYSMRLGFLSSGRAHVDGKEQNVIAGFTFGVAMDFRAKSHWYYGVSFDIHRQYLYHIGQYFIDAAATVKYMHLGSQSKVGFRPGAAVGFGRLAVVRTLDTIYLNPSNFMTLKGTLEIIFFSDLKSAFFGEVGIWYAVCGREESHDLWLGPQALLRVGVML